MNWWTEIACLGCFRLEAGAGLRYLTIDETSRADFVATGPGLFPVADGFVAAESESRFVGLQGCFAAHWDASCSVEAYGSVKAMMGRLERDTDVTEPAEPSFP